MRLRSSQCERDDIDRTLYQGEKCVCALLRVQLSVYNSASIDINRKCTVEHLGMAESVTKLVSFRFYDPMRDACALCCTLLCSAATLSFSIHWRSVREFDDSTSNILHASIWCCCLKFRTIFGKFCTIYGFPFLCYRWIWMDVIGMFELYLNVLHLSSTKSQGWRLTGASFSSLHSESNKSDNFPGFVIVVSLVIEFFQN